MRRTILVSLSLIVLLAACVRFYQLGRAELWLDEQLEYHVASQPDINSLLVEARQSGPVGPVGYLCDALALRVFGNSRWAMRFFPALFGVASVIAVYFLGRRWFSERAGLFAAALLSVSGLSVQFSREARPYSALVLCSLLTALAFDAVFRSPAPFSPFPRREGGRRVRFAVLCELAALITALVHPLAAMVFAALALGAIAAWVLDATPPPGSLPAHGEGENGKSRPLRWSIQFAIAGACLLVGGTLAYLLWWRRVPSVQFMPPGTEHSLAWHLLDIYKALIGGYWGLGSYVVAAALVLGAIEAAHHRAWRWGLCLSGAIGAIGAAPIIISFTRHMNVLPRYSIFAMPFLLLLAGAGIDRAWAFAANQRDQAPKAWTLFAAPALAVLLLLSMPLHGRSLYDLEAGKHSAPNYPALETP